MTPIPKDPALDNTLAFLAEGYSFIPSRCERLQSDVFETRIMLRKVICALGEDASAMFYRPGRFTRRQAMPPSALMLLQHVGSVQMLDGAEHRWRKQMFMSLMTHERIRHLVAIVEEAWQTRMTAWAGMDAVVLHDEAEAILCGAVCQWVGIPLTEAALSQRTREFSGMIDGAGSIGPRNWKGMLLRSRTEDWARSIVNGVRAGHMSVPVDSPAHDIAWHRDINGALLESETAAVELINLMRPTVAVARYITFSAFALHRHPACRQQIQAGDAAYLDWFVQEVRRFFPFFPAIGGRVLEPFEWRGSTFEQDDWFLLDLYGTNHDARIWGDSEVFRPERFRDGTLSAFNFIPQGGGDVDDGHRCPGERITIEIVKQAVGLLVHAMEYDVPPQDLRIDLSRLPAIPASRFVIRSVRRVPEMAVPRGEMPAAENWMPP
ncbi:MAG TPA: cytochrome P450 [Noviherbaspirillum sp.]